jgi:plasmid stability protein
MFAVILCLSGRITLASLFLRNVDPRIIDALKQRAAKNGRSAEAEHRALLEERLLPPTGKRFAEALASMPNVGTDSYFARVEDHDRPSR